MTLKIENLYLMIDPHVCQLDNIVEETFEGCMHSFHRFKCKCEYKVKFV